MKNPRTYGQPPFDVAVIHGGPGAPGDMAPVARELASDGGVLEPLQTAASLAGQVEELKTLLEKDAHLPVTLIGFSWGAWLSFICAAHYPALVKKLILVGSGPFEAAYATSIQETRLKRLSEDERIEIHSLTGILNDPVTKDKSAAFACLGALFSKADAYDPIEHESEVIDYQAHIFESVWQEAAELRKSRKLLALAQHIQCPVVAIHGDYDAHPAPGVQKPLSAALKSFRFFLLQNCGHMPWVERAARDEFYRILKEELLLHHQSAPQTSVRMASK
jgi:pimeloyl-ACP methyl ester carboxylesterase